MLGSSEAAEQPKNGIWPSRPISRQADSSSASQSHSGFAQSS